MNVPGSNLLISALRLIKPSPFILRRFIGTKTNEVGIDIRTYGLSIFCKGSIQAVDRKVYGEFGLDLTKRYIMIWSTEDINDLYRGRSGDRVVYDARYWEVTGESEWHQIDGWNSVIAVEVPKEDEITRSWAFGPYNLNFDHSNFHQPYE